MNKRLLAVAALALALPLAGCNKQPAPEEGYDGVYFQYEDASFAPIYGPSSEAESWDYNALKVNKTTNQLRDDFAFGVDASMTYDVERYGGKYYNQDGREQDVFQILKNSGVNFVRFRLWNTPYDLLGNVYGGGDNDLEVDLALAKRAKAANLNVMIDFHYSDFWADPDQQRAPADWAAESQSAIPGLISSFTRDTLNEFKKEGVTVDAVQIGNETNNGLCGYKIDWNNLNSSMDVMASMFNAGINAAKGVFPKIKTMIHLANGGNAEEFKTYFTALDARNVKYDMIGASYYPHLSGALEDLQENLNQVSELTGRPVVVAETSWGYTTDYIDGVTENTYNEKDENVGNYKTSYQAQATSLRDICDVLSKVPNNKGLGVFYWEPGWLPVEKNADPDGNKCATPWATAAGQAYQYTGDYRYRSNYKDGFATWSNQGLFSYKGKALPSLDTFRYIRTGFHEAAEQSTGLKDSTLNVTINVAASESLPTTARVATDFDAYRKANITWNAQDLEKVKTKGQYDGLVGLVDGKYQITCNAKCIENYVVDPGFENQGTTDTVKEPWVINSQSPANDKVVKIDRKKDIRSGKSDLNWYHSSKEFSFEVSQTIELNEGNYKLTTYIMGAELNKLKHTRLELFYEINGGTPVTLNLCTSEYLAGWTAGYKECVLDNIQISGQKVKLRIGLKGAAEKLAWAHNDDWELVKND